MRIGGTWVGWGLGDNSTADFTVRNFRAFARRMYASYMGDLADTNVFDSQLYDRLIQMQDRLVASGRLQPGKFIRGVLDLETEYACGFKKRPAGLKPILITVEGHMSDMFVGPCAFVASTLEGQGLVHHQPVGYDNTSIPFHNQTGIDEVIRLLNCDHVGPNNAWPFPDDLPWGLLGFSQGAIVTAKVWLHHLRPATGGRLAARRDHLRRALSFGDPYRQKDVIAEWVPDPPAKGTQGISDERMTDTPPWWKVHARHGDLYSENPDDEVGLDRTAIYKIVSENSWVGGPAGMLMRVMDIFENPPDGVFDAARAIMGGILFAANTAPHGMYDLNPCIDWMRGVAA